MSLVLLLNNITALENSFFLHTIVRTIYPGCTTIQQHLVTVPPYIVGAFFILVILTLSRRFNYRHMFITITGPTIIVEYSIFLANLYANIRYVAVFLCCTTAFALGAMRNAQFSANISSDSSRNIAIGTNAVFGYVGGLIATCTYLIDNAPGYPINKHRLSMCCGLDDTCDCEMVPGQV